MDAIDDGIDIPTQEVEMSDFVPENEDEDLNFPSPDERTRPLVLIADDDPDILEMLSEFFARKECDLVSASNGEETLYKILVTVPDLVILDVMMPGLNGWQICKYMKNHYELKDIGVLMFTAIGPVNNELTSPLFGADDYLDKPLLDFEVLTEKITNILALRRPHLKLIDQEETD